MPVTPAVDRFVTSDGVAVATHRFPPTTPVDAPLVVLQHGFAADTTANWVAPGVVDALLAAGREVLSVDARGHGLSDKPHDPAFYGETRMSRDLVELFDALDLTQLDLVGYSMGAIISVITASTDRHIRRMVIGGIGGRVADFGTPNARGLDRPAIGDALLADDPATITDPVARAFRAFADSTGADRRALAAQTKRVHGDAIALGDIVASTLLLVGDRDFLADRPEQLAAAIPDCALRIASGDHLSVLADPAFAPAIVDFLAG
jgi:pimeloyl-ACP methyl ester carboxylesterase